MFRLLETLRRGLPLVLCTMLLLVGMPAKQSCCCVAKAERIAQTEASSGSCCSKAPATPQEESECDDCRCRLDAAPEVPLGPIVESTAVLDFSLALGSSWPAFDRGCLAPVRRAFAQDARDRSPPGPLYLRLCSFRC